MEAEPGTAVARADRHHRMGHVEPLGARHIAGWGASPWSRGGIALSPRAGRGVVREDSTARDRGSTHSAGGGRALVRGIPGARGGGDGALRRAAHSGCGGEYGTPTAIGEDWESERSWFPTF